MLIGREEEQGETDLTHPVWGKKSQISKYSRVCSVYYNYCYLQGVSHPLKGWPLGTAITNGHIL